MFHLLLYQKPLHVNGLHDLLVVDLARRFANNAHDLNVQQQQQQQHLVQSSQYLGWFLDTHYLSHMNVAPCHLGQKVGVGTSSRSNSPPILH